MKKSKHEPLSALSAISNDTKGSMSPNASPTKSPLKKGYIQSPYQSFSPFKMRRD